MKNIRLQAVLITALGFTANGQTYWHEDLRAHIGKDVLVVGMYELGVSPSERNNILVLSCRDLSRICVAEPLACVSQLLPPTLDK